MFEQNKEQAKKIIFIDIDDTLADTRRAVYNLYVEVTGDASGSINTKSKRYTDFCPTWTDEQVSDLFKTGYTLYEKVECIPGAKEAVNELIKRDYDVRIATIHVATGVPAKQEWIDKHFPMLSEKVYYINSTNANKDVFEGHSIIDDDLRNIKNNKSIKPILLDFYGIYDNTRVIQCKTWKEVLSNL